MSERDGYQAGVPCWVDTWQPDAAAAAGFYTQLFGWTAENIMPADSPARYFMCKLRGHDVAAVGGPSPGQSLGQSPEGALPVQTRRGRSSASGSPVRTRAPSSLTGPEPGP